jgi:hypothetical protein
LWWRGLYRASNAIAVWDYLARQLGLIRCQPAYETEHKTIADGVAP